MKKDCSWISAKGLMNMIEKFEQTDALEVKSRKKAKSISSTSVEDVDSMGN